MCSAWSRSPEALNRFHTAYCGSIRYFELAGEFLNYTGNISWACDNFKDVQRLDGVGDKSRRSCRFWIGCFHRNSGATLYFVRQYWQKCRLCADNRKLSIYKLLLRWIYGNNCSPFYVLALQAERSACGRLP